MILTNRNRKLFDVTNKQDVERFKQFLVKSGWGAEGCPFEIEQPWLTIPDMIKDKLIRHYLKIGS